MRVAFTFSAVMAALATSCASLSGLDSYSNAEVRDGAAVKGGEEAAASEGGGSESLDDEASTTDAPCPDLGCADGWNPSDSPVGEDATKAAGEGDAPSGGGAIDGTPVEASCVPASLPPSINVDSSQWTFATSPSWSCTNDATTTINAEASGASISGDDCGGSATLADVSNDFSQTTGGPNVLVIRLSGLTVSGNHVVQLAGTEPVVFLVAGSVTIDSGGKIDASADGTTGGPGGNSSECGTSTGAASTATAAGGGGGGFGTGGGYGADSSGNRASAGGAVASNLTLQPLRGGCAGGAGANGVNAGSAGGGAFEIAASGTIAIGATSTAYLGAAGGYSPGASTSVDSNGSGGAGSGGAVLLASPIAATFANGSVVRAHGGGSGSGRGLSSSSNPGTNGSATSNTPAAGGAAPDQGGAAGAAGGLCAGSGTNCAVAQAGSNGGRASVVADGSGGGGGGGSVRVISAPNTAVCR